MSRRRRRWVNVRMPAVTTELAGGLELEMPIVEDRTRQDTRMRRRIAEFVAAWRAVRHYRTAGLRTLSGRQVGELGGALLYFDPRDGER